MAAMIATAAAAAISGYLIGSIPIADAVARRAAGIDLRAVGDRNPGFWNAKSALGPRAALPVFIGDAMKGSIAAAIGLALASDGRWWIGYVASFAAMAGHAWPVFARFRGGRSVSSFAGAVCVLAPAAAAVSIALLVIVLATTRSFAWAARVAVFGFPAIQIVLDGPYRTAATGCLMTLIGLRFALAALSRTNALANPDVG